MSNLRVYDNDNDWVVAESGADAEAVMHEQTGATFEDGEVEWEALPVDKPLTMHDENGPTVTLTCAQWAAKGRAYLGSENW